jgi:hypothetical protein
LSKPLWDVHVARKRHIGNSCAHQYSAELLIERYNRTRLRKLLRRPDKSEVLSHNRKTPVPVGPPPSAPSEGQEAPQTG